MQATTTPLATLLTPRERFNADLETILTDLESYLVRRLLVGLTSKNYNRLFFELLQDLEGKQDFSPASVHSSLAAFTGDTRA